MSFIDIELMFFEKIQQVSIFLHLLLHLIFLLLLVDLFREGCQIPGGQPDIPEELHIGADSRRTLSLALVDKLRHDEFVELDQLLVVDLEVVCEIFVHHIELVHLHDIVDIPQVLVLLLQERHLDILLLHIIVSLFVLQVLFCSSLVDEPEVVLASSCVVFIEHFIAWGILHALSNPRSQYRQLIRLFSSGLLRYLLGGRSIPVVELVLFALIFDRTVLLRQPLELLHVVPNPEILIVVFLEFLSLPVVHALLHILVGQHELLVRDIGPVGDDGLFAQTNELVIGFFVGILVEEVVEGVGDNGEFLAGADLPELVDILDLFLLLLGEHFIDKIIHPSVYFKRISAGAVAQIITGCGGSEMGRGWGGIIKEIKIGMLRLLINIKTNRFSTLTRTIMDDNTDKQGATVITEHNRELFLEGKAKIYTKYVETNAEGKLVENGVFYNPVQIFNRDFTLLVMQAYIHELRQKKGQKFEGAKIIDALSASGLRTIRFLKELEGVGMVYANDISPASHKLMRDNFDINELDESKLKMTMEDANLLLLNEKKNIVFDIVDLDPYGSVVPFLDASVESIRDGGLMCVTCTDTKVTCGPDISKCYYYYGTTRAKVQHFNENALRIVLSTISSAASRHCKYIEPLVSFQTDFYLRVFVVVRRGKKECAESGTKIGNIYNCNFCGNYEYHSHFMEKNNKNGQYVPNRVFLNSTQCQICDQPYFLNGPVWLGALNNLSFVDKLMKMMEKEDFSLKLKTHKKVYGTLYAIAAEKELSEVPLGFNFDLMCKHVKAPTPNRKILYAGMESQGFKVAPSYISPGVYKTNAPFKAIYDTIKTWKLQSSGQEKYLTNVKEERSLNILKKEIEYKPNFQFEVEKQKRVPHFISMGSHMGPKGKPESRVLTEEEVAALRDEQKQQQQQNNSNEPKPEE